MQKVSEQTFHQPLVQVDHISLIQDKRTLLEEVSLSIFPEQIVSIVGPNGAGKTTLVKLIVGLLEPTRGKVIRQPKLKIGYMPQRLQIDPIFPLTVGRFLKLGQPKVDVQNALREVGVSGIIDSPLYAISGGELQRVLLARALLRQPQLLVLDEPAQGVDLMGQAELYALINRICKKHRCAILLVSHDLNVVMAQTDFVVCLNQHVCCSGHPEKVSQDPEFSALFGQVAHQLAFYTHHHDHHHGVEGAVGDEKERS